MFFMTFFKCEIVGWLISASININMKKKCFALLILLNVSPMWQQAFRQQVSGPVDLFVVVSKLGMNRVGGQQHGCLWGTVNLVAQDALLHLQEEKLLRDFLDQLFRHVLWKELGPKLELQWVLLLHVL